MAKAVTVKVKTPNWRAIEESGADGLTNSRQIDETSSLVNEVLSLAKSVSLGSGAVDEVKKVLEVKAAAIAICLKYRQFLGSDTLAPIQAAMKLTPKQLDVVQAQLTKNKLIKGFSEGKITLRELYNLPNKEIEVEDDKK